MHCVEFVDPAGHLVLPVGSCCHPQHRVAGHGRAADVPVASETLGHWLHALTGKWNLEDYIGHDLYVVAASAVVYNALGRLQDDHALQRTFKQYVELPATLCIPLLLATFTLGNGARIYRPDFFEVPTDFWLSAYWLLLCGTLIYLLGYGSRALMVLRKDPRSRNVANVYLIASFSGIMACVVRIVTSLVPSSSPSRGHTGVDLRLPVRRRLRLTSAHSWRIKTKWFSKASH